MLKTYWLYKLSPEDSRPVGPRAKTGLHHKREMRENSVLCWNTGLAVVNQLTLTTRLCSSASTLFRFDSQGWKHLELANTVHS